ncbi:MAG: hypothetical protein PWR27_1723 [Petroclostridium sp.]|jgi:hypothetical protein|nr:hypothetical protein [Clostridia bacterium]MDK2811014.1 hypothetical protein [Petroclostridium sp.]
MVSEKECVQEMDEKYWLEEDKKVEKDCQHKGHFQVVFLY